MVLKTNGSGDGSSYPGEGRLLTAKRSLRRVNFIFKACLECIFFMAFSSCAGISQSYSLSPTSGQPAPIPALHINRGMPSPRRPAPGRYTVLSVAPGGLRSGRQPLNPHVQLEERGLQRGDFSLWLRPALSTDAGEYHATVRLPDRALFCSLRLRVGQASSRWGRTKGEGLGSRSLLPQGRGSSGQRSALDPA